MMNNLMNSMRQTAMQSGQRTATTRQGTVTSYDPGSYAIKVTLQPDGVVTGWLPLKSAWVGGEWGMFCPPSIGDLVEVDYQEGDAGVGSSGWRFYNDTDRPLPCPSGEFWVVHKSGSLFKFHNDGSVEQHTAGNFTHVVEGDYDVSVTGNINFTSPMMTQNGDLTVNGSITQGAGGSGGTTSLIGPVTVTNDVTAGGKSAIHHTHSGVQTGGGETGEPV